MSKNMFEDPKNQRLDLFSNFKNMLPNEPELLKKSYQQSVLNATMEFKAKCSDQTFREVQETAPHKKAKVQIQEPPDADQPAMYKIALKIKKLTEEKFSLKKSASMVNSASTSSVTNAGQELKSCIKKQSANSEDSKSLLEVPEENFLSAEFDSLADKSNFSAVFY